MAGNREQTQNEPAASAAVVLLSGGLDSATAAAWAREQGFELYALSFDYGQRHRFEIEAAQRIAQWLGVREHRVLRIDLSPLLHSALTGTEQVPRGRSLDAMSQGIPVTYVPARNTIMLSVALGWAEVLGAANLVIGVNAVDYSGYPDCRPEYVAAFEKLANLATKAGVEETLRFRVHTPLIRWTKGEIIRYGTERGVPYEWTHTCYDPDLSGRPCGQCDACLLRIKGFEEAGLQDPLCYPKA